MSFTVADRQDYLLGRERLPQNEAAVFVETRFANTTNFVRNESLDQIITIEEDDKRAQIRFVFVQLRGLLSYERLTDLSLCQHRAMEASRSRKDPDI